MVENLVENAIDFMEVSLRELESSPKYSVINFCSAVEIFFKARLMAEHWSLVVAKPESATLSKFQEGDFRSVTLDHAITRLEKIAGETFSKHAKATFKALREHRNKLVHFFHPEYVSGPNQQAITQQIVSEQCRAWLHLHKLLTSQWKPHFADFSKQISELDKLIHEHREFLREKFKSIGTKLKVLMKASEKIVTCSACGFHASHQTEDTPPIKDSKCLVCGSTDRYLYMPCPDCGKDQVYAGDGDFECADCGKSITVDDIIEEVTPEELKNPPDEPCEDLLAYCCDCDHSEPSVVKLSNDWVCLACLGAHDEPDRCSWCNTFTTGDLEGSGYFGCPHCEGKRGWDSDD
jgi:hypothetical protein